MQIKNIKKIITSHEIAFLLIVMYILNCWLLFPGAFTYDSLSQYNQALSGKYSMHHPPVMAFLWSFLIKFFHFPSTMLFFNLALLWGSCSNFYKILELFNSKWKYLYLILPWTPWILGYSIVIWKDVAFSYSYLYVYSCVSLILLKNKPIGKSFLFFILLILFYGSAVKYQARFVLPLASLFLGQALSKTNQYKHPVMIAITIFLLIFFAQEKANRYLTCHNQETQCSSSWHSVKLYDLSGISVAQNKALFPKEILESESFDFGKVKELYNNKLADPLINANIFQHKNDQELYSYWLNTIIKHPYDYMRHRILLLVNSIIKENHICLPKYGLDNPVEASFTESLKLTLLDKYLYNLKKLSALSIWLIFIPLYIALGYFLKKKIDSEIGNILLFMNLTSLLLIIVITPFSMASEARYLLLSLLMISFSHPLVIAGLNTLQTHKIFYRIKK